MTVESERSSTNFSLIERIRADESRAWQELMDLYGPLVAHWCRRLGVPERSVSDGVQNVFVAVLRTISGFRPSLDRSDSKQAKSQRSGKYGFRSWLWGVTRHKCIDMLRSEGRHPKPDGGSTAHQALEQQPAQAKELDCWEDYTEAKEITGLLQRAMHQVAAEFEEKTWQAFLRTTVDGLSTAAVGEELGMDAATVRKYRSRVLRRLRRQLGEID